MRLKDKVAIVTGGGRDIGKAVSIKLAREGARVVINYRNNKDQACETKKIIESEGGKAILVQGDMTKAADVQTLLREAQQNFGNDIHILVNVAGGLVARKKLNEIEEGFWEEVMQLNLKTALLASHVIAPHIPEGGAIINFSSQAGRDGGGPGAIAYATAKGALMTFTRALAKDLGPRNIRVNAVLPGMISTTFHDTFTKPEVRANVAKATPLGREGKATEVADLVAYLASSEASFITGANIDINGGFAFS